MWIGQTTPHTKLHNYIPPDKTIADRLDWNDEDLSWGFTLPQTAHRNKEAALWFVFSMVRKILETNSRRCSWTGMLDIRIKSEKRGLLPRNPSNDSRICKVGHQVPIVDSLNIEDWRSSVWLSYQYKVSATKIKWRVSRMLEMTLIILTVSRNANAVGSRFESIQPQTHRRHATYEARINLCVTSRRAWIIQHI